MTRTKHISFAIGLLERMSDKDLKECFPNNTLAEARERLKELRAKGLKYFPCQCETRNADGSCKGWIKPDPAKTEQGVVNEIRS